MTPEELEELLEDAEIDRQEDADREEEISFARYGGL